MREIDLTKVDLNPKGLAMLFVGIVILIAVASLAMWAYNKISGKVGASTSAVGSGFP